MPGPRTAFVVLSGPSITLKWAIRPRRKKMKKVYAIQTSEPLHIRFETGLVDGIGNIYEDRETAQVDADSYNAEFNDEVPAFVVELDFVPTMKDITLTEAVKA
jgi:hypothetical protein